MTETTQSLSRLTGKWIAVATIALAAVICTCVIAVMSGSPDPREVYARGIEAARRQDWKTVEECARQMAGRPEFHPHYSILNGFLELSQERNDRALVQFSQGQRHPDTREESYLQAGKICYGLREYREAIHLLQQVVAWNPEHLDAYRLLSAAQYDIGAMDHAMEGLNQVIRLAPQDYRPYYMQGCILQDYEQFQSAAGVFETAASMVTDNSTEATDIRVAWSDCLLRLGRHQEALNVLVAARDVPEVWLRKTEACYYLRDYEQAHTLIDQVLSEMPDNVDAITLAVRLCEQSREFQRGMELIQPAVERHPMNVRLLTSAADVFGAAGRLDEAEEFRNRAGEAGALHHRFSQLHQDALKQVENVALRIELGQVAEQLGMIPIARSWFEAALGMAPEDPLAQQEWSRFCTAHPETHQSPAE